MTQPATSHAAAASRSLAELAEICGGRVAGAGDAERAIVGVRTLEAAGPDDLSFLASARYLDAARSSRAGVLLLSPEHEDEFSSRPLLVSDDPYRALARLLSALFPVSRPRPGVHATAVVGEGCDIAESAVIGPYCVLGDDVVVAEDAWLEGLVSVGSRCFIGRGTVLHSQVVLYAGVSLGEACEVHSGTVLGADGFGFATEGDLPMKLPQVGHVRVGDRVEIGANSAVDRATLEDTVIGDDTKIDNLVQIGHNVEIGPGSILCGQSGVAGSAKLGRQVVLAGQAGVAGHLRVGDGVRVGAAAAVLGSVSDGQDVCGVPAIPMAQWRRSAAAYAKLSELRRRVARLERELENLVDEERSRASASDEQEESDDVG